MNKDAGKLDQAVEEDYAETWDSLEDVSAQFGAISRRRDRQLNLRVDEVLLSSLRDVATRAGEGYHTFARRLIEEGVARATEHQEAMVPVARSFRQKELMLVLLGAPGAAPQDEAVVGRTRLQKLLFLVAQHLNPDVSARFEAYSYGPFDERVESDVSFLADEGLVEIKGRPTPPRSDVVGPDRGNQIIEWVRARASTEQQEAEEIETYRLTRAGLSWVERFFASDEFGSSESKLRLRSIIEETKQEFGRLPLEELVDRIYAAYPEFAAKSRIREQVAARRARKVSRG